MSNGVRSNRYMGVASGPKQGKHPSAAGDAPGSFISAIKSKGGGSTKARKVGRKGR